MSATLLVLLVVLPPVLEAVFGPPASPAPLCGGETRLRPAEMLEGVLPLILAPLGLALAITGDGLGVWLLATALLLQTPRLVRHFKIRNGKGNA